MDKKELFDKELMEKSIELEVQLSECLILMKKYKKFYDKYHPLLSQLHSDMEEDYCQSY